MNFKKNHSIIADLNVFNLQYEQLSKTTNCNFFLLLLFFLSKKIVF